MKKILISFMTMLFMATSIMAQNTTVSGVLVDKSLGEGEPFATIRVFKQNTKEKPVAMFLTDENGRFSHEIKGQGHFDIVFSSVGKEDLRRTIELGNGKNLNLDTLFLDKNSTTLKGVEVVAQKPLVIMTVDKMSYNVEEDEDAKSNTVLDMLRKVPMVTVDGQDNISVNGSSSFKVYVDGKPSVMFSSNPSMMFKNMPATLVKSIEVVTNPGARYDAEGVGGVLNIVMNKQNGQAAQSLDGFNGTIRASVGNKSLGGSVFVSGQQGKFSYSANIMENYSTPGTTKVDIEQRNGNADIL
ncbi:MAG: carboxypeptidase-like regulatory domain-containing protein, partial [Prevotella sp.]|nr:carboxypeptidase-like regulatory domain-containing protein [Prevotella sp.]